MKKRRDFIKTSLTASTGLLMSDIGLTFGSGRNTEPILAIAAHPGDGMFTMGGAVAQHLANGGKGTFLSLSLGERGHNSIPAEEYGLLQVEAMEKASGMLGAEAAFLDYPDAEIPFDEEISLTVCDVIRRVKPSFKPGLSVIRNSCVYIIKQ